jgi:multisubunit Na+/H+ antiporter MnhC subunit
MFDSIKAAMVTWRTSSDDRTKMQHTYIAIAVALLLAAGLVGLINRELGERILTLALMSAAVFLINAVVWSLLQSAILARVPSRKPAIRKK